MATLINGVVIKRFNTLLELYNYNSDRLGEEVYVLDTAGDNNSPGGYSIYKKNFGDNNWDRIFDSISISTKLKELILDIDTFGNAVSLDEDIIEFSNATVLSTISENGNDVLIEDVIFSAGASNYPIKSSPNNIVVGQQYAGKKFRAICTVSNAVDKNTSFEDNPNLQLTKSNLELENVDNTSDIDKAISTATQTALDNKLNLDSILDITKVEDDNNVSLPTLLNDKADTSSLGLIDDNGVQKYEKITMRYGEYNDGLTSGGFAYFKAFFSKAYVFGVKRYDDVVLSHTAGNGQFWAYGFNTISDKRFKKDIKDISIETIDKLSKIKPKTFVYDGISDDVHIGYIAQELEKSGLDFVVNETLEEREFQNENEAKKHFEKVKKQGFDPQIKKNENDYLVTYYKKGVKYNEIAVLQQALINDLQSVLKTQNLFFSIDDIDTVYDNVIDNTYEVLTKDGNLIKSIEKNNNYQHKRIIEFIKNGGKVENKFSSKDEEIKYIQDINKSKISNFYSSKIVRKIDDKSYSLQNWSEECDTCKNVIIEYSTLTKPTKDEKLELEKAKKIVSNTNFLVLSYRKYIKQNILNLQEVIEDNEVENIFLDFVEQSSNKKYISKIKDIISV